MNRLSAATAPQPANLAGDRGTLAQIFLRFDRPNSTLQLNPDF